MSEPKRLELEFGALAPRLSKQLAGRGLQSDAVEHWQKDADAICRLGIRGFIPDAAKRRAYQRLVNEIAKSLSRESRA